MSEWIRIRGKIIVPGNVDPHKLFGKETYAGRDERKTLGRLDILRSDEDYKKYEEFREEEFRRWENSLDDLWEHEDEYMPAGSEGTPHLSWVKDKSRTTIWIDGALRSYGDNGELVGWFAGRVPKNAKFAYIAADWCGVDLCRWCKDWTDEYGNPEIRHKSLYKNS